VGVEALEGLAVDLLVGVEAEFLEAVAGPAAGRLAAFVGGR
jgi:hypothetical protein